MGTLKDILLVEYDHEMATTRKLLARVPEDQLQWAPHEKSRTLGVLAAHLCSIPTWGNLILNESSFDLAGGTPAPGAKASRQEILGAFDESSARTRASMNKTDPEYLALWALTRGRQEIFTMPRIAAFRTFVLYHIVHHRGQLSVYLRLHDIAVPAMYGPTADEG